MFKVLSKLLIFACLFLASCISDKEKALYTDFYVLDLKKETDATVKSKAKLSKFSFGDGVSSAFVGTTVLEDLSSPEVTGESNNGLYGDGFSRLIFCRPKDSMKFDLRQTIKSNVEIADGKFIFNDTSDILIYNNFILGLATQDVYYDAPNGIWRKQNAYPTNVIVNGKISVASEKDRNLPEIRLTKTTLSVEDNGSIVVGDTKSEKIGYFSLKKMYASFEDSTVDARVVADELETKWSFYGVSTIISRDKSKILGDISIYGTEQAYASDCRSEENTSKAIFKGVLLAPRKISSVLGYNMETKVLTLGSIEAEQVDLSGTVVTISSCGLTGETKFLAALKGTKLLLIKCAENINAMPRLENHLEEEFKKAKLKLVLQYDPKTKSIYVVVTG